MMFVDLDDFKEVNDRLGHAAGDRLLAAVADPAARRLRDTDVLGPPGRRRIPGAAHRPHGDPATGAESVASKLLERSREPFVVAGAELMTAASVGVSIYPETPPTPRRCCATPTSPCTRPRPRRRPAAFHQRRRRSLARRSASPPQLRRAIAAFRARAALPAGLAAVAARAGSRGSRP